MTELLTACSEAARWGTLHNSPQKCILIHVRRNGETDTAPQPLQEGIMAAETTTANTTQDLTEGVVRGWVKGYRVFDDRLAALITEEYGVEVPRESPLASGEEKRIWANSVLDRMGEAAEAAMSRAKHLMDLVEAQKHQTAAEVNQYRLQIAAADITAANEMQAAADMTRLTPAP